MSGPAKCPKGVDIVKVYKYKNKLCCYLPYNVLGSLSIKEGDELDFIEFNSNAFLVSKKSDILGLIMQQNAKHEPEQQAQRFASRSPSEAEISVLKKIDTLRYNERTKENVSKLLNSQEKEILAQMVRKDFLKPFRSRQGIEVYSISKSIYDGFLMRKGARKAAGKEEQHAAQDNDSYTYSVRSKSPEDDSIKELSKKGFIVLLSEAEASRVSILLEEDIRLGKVLGTRAFNKKFYIALREYINQYSPGVIKSLKEGPAKTEEIARKAGMEPEGAKAILYILAENGEITEKRKDLFALA